MAPSTHGPGGARPGSFGLRRPRARHPGLQTANLIFDLAEPGWRAEDHGVELPLSVKTLADVKQLRDKFGLKDDALQHIDRALE